MRCHPCERVKPVEGASYARNGAYGSIVTRDVCELMSQHYLPVLRIPLSSVSGQEDQGGCRSCCKRCDHLVAQQNAHILCNSGEASLSSDLLRPLRNRSRPPCDALECRAPDHHSRNHRKHAQEPQSRYPDDRVVSDSCSARHHGLTGSLWRRGDCCLSVLNCC